MSPVETPLTVLSKRDIGLQCPKCGISGVDPEGKGHGRRFSR